jgi:hypothetical protein
VCAFVYLYESRNPELNSKQKQHSKTGGTETLRPNERRGGMDVVDSRAEKNSSTRVSSDLLSDPVTARMLSQKNSGAANPSSDSGDRGSQEP